MIYNFDDKVFEVFPAKTISGAGSVTGSVNTLGYGATQFILDVSNSSTPATAHYGIYSSNDNFTWVLVPGSNYTLGASADGIAVWNISAQGGTYNQYLCLSGSQASGTATVCAVATCSEGIGVNTLDTTTIASPYLGFFQI